MKKRTKYALGSIFGSACLGAAVRKLDSALGLAIFTTGVLLIAISNAKLAVLEKE